MPKKHPILGSMIADQVGPLLNQEGFYNFCTTTGVIGLAKIEGDKLEILAIEAVVKGKRHGRKFITKCMGYFMEVHVWLVWNEKFAETLQSLGFHRSSVPEEDRWIYTKAGVLAKSS